VYPEQLQIRRQGILDESDGSGNITNEYVFFGGRRIAMDLASGGSITSTYYYA